jgi:hypothetical protein
MRSKCIGHKRDRYPFSTATRSPTAYLAAYEIDRYESSWRRVHDLGGRHTIADTTRLRLYGWVWDHPGRHTKHSTLLVHASRHIVSDRLMNHTCKREDEYASRDIHGSHTTTRNMPTTIHHIFILLQFLLDIKVHGTSLFVRRYYV